MNKQWIRMASDRHSISKLNANFSCTQFIQDTPVPSINMPQYSCPLSPSADVAKSWKGEAAIAHEFLIQQGKGCRKKNICGIYSLWSKTFRVSYVIILKHNMKLKAAFRLRCLFKKHFLQRGMQEPMPAGSPYSYRLSPPMCMCITWQKEPSRYLNSISLCHKHDVQWDTSTHL